MAIHILLLTVLLMLGGVQVGQAAGAIRRLVGRVTNSGGLKLSQGLKTRVQDKLAANSEHAGALRRLEKGKPAEKNWRKLRKEQQKRLEAANTPSQAQSARHSYVLSLFGDQSVQAIAKTIASKNRPKKETKMGVESVGSHYSPTRTGVSRVLDVIELHTIELAVIMDKKNKRTYLLLGEDGNPYVIKPDATLKTMRKLRATDIASNKKETGDTWSPDQIEKALVAMTEKFAANDLKGPHKNTRIIGKTFKPKAAAISLFYKTISTEPFPEHFLDIGDLVKAENPDKYAE